MALIMRAPRSYTREDVAEIQVHGGEQVVSSILNSLFVLGAVPAQPGEFTRRAFLNGRIDLSQAEAVMQLIASTGSMASDAALRQLQGGALRFIQDAQAELLKLMAGITAAIDYPEEIDEAEAVEGILPGINRLASCLQEACDERAARVLEEGLHVVICGKPNVGKSSLLNALLMEERAIVTDIPGTTRDLVTGAVELEGIRVLLKDTAGIRKDGETVEMIGVQRALDAIKSADLRVMVLDASRRPDSRDEMILDTISGFASLAVLNKCDLPLDADIGKWLEGKGIKAENTILLSARTGEGLDILRREIRAHAGNLGENALTLARHTRLAREAAQSLRNAAQAMKDELPLDLCMVDLNQALLSLGAITGENVSEALLDEVFSAFCVGK
jgi:tRNA modification GTPase